MMEMCGWYIFKMSQKVKVGGAWKDAVPYLKVGGSWKVPKSIHNKVNGEWKNSFLQGGLNDSSFTTYDTYSGFNGGTRSGTVQSDGKVIIIGDFTTWNSIYSSQIIRLNSDSSIDTTFKTNIGTAANGSIYSVEAQSDGKILVGGAFDTWNGVTVNRIVRLNSDGTRDTTFTTNAGTAANGSIQSTTTQSDGKILLVGLFTTWNGTTVNYIVRLNSDGTRDTTFTTNAGTAANDLVYKTVVQSDGKIIVAGNFTTWNGTSVNHIVRLNSDGTRETSFTTNTGPSEIGAIYDIALQSDGKIIVGGSFPNWNGVVSINNIVRLNSDGTRDTAFTTNVGTGSTSEIYSIGLQSDGKIILGGVFTFFNGISTNRIVRLNSDGTRDTTFSTNVGTGANSYIQKILIMPDQRIIVLGDFITFNTSFAKYIFVLNSDGTRNLSFISNVSYAASSTVSIVTLQPDGKILLGGAFSTWNGVNVYFIVRLNSDGTRDATFTTNTGTGASSNVFSISLQADGKILVGGAFSTWNGVTVNRIVRLNSDGTRDTTFTTNAGTAANSLVQSIVLQPDGKILLGGVFSTWNGTTVNYIVRLNSDGTRDTTFTTNTGTAGNSTVSRILLQTDGKIIAVGNFTTWNGVTVNRIVRLNSDGTRDTTFTTNTGTAASSNVNSIALQSDGKILLGGSFLSWNGTTVNYIVRLNSDGTRDTTFTTNVGTAGNSTPATIVIQSNGKIVIGGNFTTWNGVSVYYIVRLNSDGTRDTAFTNNIGMGTNAGISSIALDSDGRMILGGSFSSFQEIIRNYIARIGGDFAG